MQSALASGDLEFARSLADEIQALSENLDHGHSYYGLWHLLTRVKWLYLTDQADAGVAVAMDAIPRIERMADRNLLERMKLLAAEGLGRIGRAADGARLMAEAVSANPDPPLEMLAEASRVAGRLTADDNQAAAASYFDRAARILVSVGNLTAGAEIQRDALETAPRTALAGTAFTGGDSGDGLAVGEDPPSHDGPDRRPPAAALTERIAALVDLAAHPPLLATETLSLIADTQAALHARIVETRPDGTHHWPAAYAAPDAPAWRADHPDTIRMALGSHRDRQFAIAALPRPTATARATLLAVERMVHTALALARARHQEREQTALWPEPSPEQQLGLVCASERMLELVKSVRRVAPSNVTVLITGETGVGKELFARALHQASARHDRLFLPFNCTTVPRDIIDSQLFGYRRGAFTGALDDSPGLIRAAAGGTLFLDEIGEMSAEAQPKLLRFLESGEILPLGETRPQFVDVRVVAATNANLDQLVTEGRFREDLYYRLNVIPLHVPPLRERREEIPLLVEHFLDKFAHELQKPMLRVAEETLEYLVLYRWPGNVRQLANEVRRMVALAEPGAVLMPEHLSSVIAASRRTVPANQRTLEPTEMVMRIDQPLAAAAEHLERALIQRALKTCDGKVEDAAKMLGLSRKGLYLKRMRLGIE
jgi:DNA-binding NtrC family response regulator